MKPKDGKYKLALVVHSVEIVDEVRKLSDPDIEELNVTLVDLDQAVPAARKLLSLEFEVILGHGGTGALMTQKIGHSVVNIPTTLMDLIYAVRKAKEHGRRIAITSFGELREGMDLIEDFLDIDLRQIVFNSTRELRYGVYAAIEDGFRVIVGGGVSRKMIADRQGQGVIIRPNPKTVQHALIQARAIARAKRREQEKSHQLQTTLQIVSEGVIGIDARGRLNFSNRAATDILGNLENRVGKPFSHLNRELGLVDVLISGTPQIDEFKTIRGRNLLINSLPIRIEDKVRGAVALFREVESIQNTHRKLREKMYQRGFSAKHRFDDIRWCSPRMGMLIERAQKFSTTQGTVLIEGETGTGKELLAHAIHHHSPRKDRPFVAINCAALPETLLESELFGYEEGAFTGAKKGGKIGLFELANKGTIYLDEIGDITPGLQLRLIRVLEAREVMRVGGDRIVPVDVRVLASTHKDLVEGVRSGKFRADLYYRLAQLRLLIPPLRQRPEDIPAVTSNLLARCKQNMDSLSPTIIQNLRQYSWPGNVRELNSFLESYFILLGEKKCDEKLFLELFREHIEHTGLPNIPERIETKLSRKKNLHPTPAAPLKTQLSLTEKTIIEEALIACEYNRKKTAKLLGIGTNTLWRKVKSAKIF